MSYPEQVYNGDGGEASATMRPAGAAAEVSSGTGTIVTSAQAFDAELVVAVTLEAGPGASAPGGPIVAAGKAA